MTGGRVACVARALQLQRRLPLKQRPLYNTGSFCYTCSRRRPRFDAHDNRGQEVDGGSGVCYGELLAQVLVPLCRQGGCGSVRHREHCPKRYLTDLGCSS